MTAGEGRAWLDAWTSEGAAGRGDRGQCDRYLAGGPAVRAAFRARFDDLRAIIVGLLVLRRATAAWREEIAARPGTAC